MRRIYLDSYADLVNACHPTPVPEARHVRAEGCSPRQGFIPRYGRDVYVRKPIPLGACERSDAR